MDTVTFINAVKCVLQATSTLALSSMDRQVILIQFCYVLLAGVNLMLADVNALYQAVQNTMPCYVSSICY